jgi:adenylosuccinate synthase
MSVWVIVGGQYGSEGKGKIAAFITLREQIDICVRCGGPNSGHCFVDESGEFRALRQIPTGYVRPEARLLIPSGGLIDLEVLRRELEMLCLGPDRVGIDRRAMVIEESDRIAEQELNLRERLSSTLCGVGSAVSRRVLRGEDVRLANDAAQQASWLKPYLVDVSAEINDGIDHGKNILVEGTQGFGLSLYHSEAYPKATSRDTSAAGCISECGISPRLVTEIVLVLRTFPIRVAGEQAGPMFEEIDWETIQRESGYPHPVAEYTTVTKKLRRVGRFDWDSVRRAMMLNRPTQIAINFLDYLGFDNCGAADWDSLGPSAQSFVETLEGRYDCPVSYLGTGPSLSNTVLRHTRCSSRVALHGLQESEVTPQIQ